MKSRQNRARQLYFVMTMLVLLTPGCTVMAQESIDRGQLLYENHCQDCHDKTVHTRDERKATSPELLRAWVMSWSIHNGLFWGQDEIADITAYLDQSVYRFPE